MISADGQKLSPNGVKEYDAGDRVTLTCLAEGAPDPEYIWGRLMPQGGFQTISSGDNVQVQRDGSLK